MSTIVTQAAQKINADTAGMTHIGAEQPTAQAISPAELLGPESFGSIFTGGFHPDGLIQIVDNSLVKPTMSLPGKLGGLVPLHASGSAPGPAGESATIAQVLHDAVTPAKVSKVKDWLRARLSGS